MSGRLAVDTERLHDLAAASQRARRGVEDEADVLRHGARDGGRASEQDKLEAGYHALHRRALGLLGDLAASLGQFGRALDQIADGYTAADDGGSAIAAGRTGWAPP